MLMFQLSEEIEKIDVKMQYTLDDYCGFLDQMVEKVFGRRYKVVKEDN